MGSKNRKNATADRTEKGELDEPGFEASTDRPETDESKANANPLAVTQGEKDEGMNALADIPAPMRKVFESFMAVSFAPGRNPLYDKFTEGHIDKLLDYSHAVETRDHDLDKTGRWFRLGYFLIALAFFVFLIIFLTPNNRDLLEELIKAFILFMGGFGAGFGYKFLRDRAR